MLLRLPDRLLAAARLHPRRGVPVERRDRRIAVENHSREVAGHRARLIHRRASQRRGDGLGIVSAADAEKRNTPGARPYSVVSDNNNEKQETARGPGQRFVPGQSGNPAGRPRGSRNKSTVLCLNLLDGAGEAVMTKAVELAKAGDPVALRLCIDRLVPRGPRPVVLDLPRVAKAADLAEAAQAIVTCAAAGEISLEEARGFLALLTEQRKIVETVDLALRIEVLELAHARRKRGQ